MSSDRMAFAVLGAGGVGGLLAALLARAGDEVLVLASEGRAAELAAGGITVESRRFGDFTARVDVAERLERPVDALLVTVKATQLTGAVDRVPPSALGDALVIPFLNGFDHVEFLRTVYPPATVAPATIRIETIKTATGRIRHTSPFAAIEIATTDAVRHRVERIVEHLGAAGLDARTIPDEHAMLWSKFALLEPMALLTTHARAGVGTIRSERRDDLLALLDEVALTARAEGVTVDAASMLRLVDAAPADMSTSMERDQSAGRPMELEALGGALLRRAARAGVEVPVHARLVKEIEARNPQ